MEIKELKIKGSFEITLKPNSDKRGFFMRTYDKNVFESNGLVHEWVQENHSKSVEMGILRGLHLQLPPFSETKLVRCIRGSVLDVFVDLRHNSNTFGVWDSIELSAENNKMIYIPRGCAHGFCTTSEKSEILYKVDNYYSPDSECGILWNDEEIGINWPVLRPILSNKDKFNLTLKEFINKYNSIKV